MNAIPNDVVPPPTTYDEFSPSWLDRQWFDLRADRSYRMRQPMLIEIAQFGDCTHIVVVKVGPRDRMRIPVTFQVKQHGRTELLDILCGDTANPAILDLILAELVLAIQHQEKIDLSEIFRRAV